jgi:nucleoside-diphosphate-sugar epimerase
MTRVLVSGGTGRVGHLVVKRLTGYDVRAMRHTRQAMTGNLPGPGATLGHRTWEEFLADQKP